jgi:hypothetical protein
MLATKTCIPTERNAHSCDSESESRRPSAELLIASLEVRTVISMVSFLVNKLLNLHKTIPVCRGVSTVCCQQYKDSAEVQYAVDQKDVTEG